MTLLQDLTILALFLLMAIGCDKSTPNVPQPTRVDAKTEPDVPTLTRVDAKTESDGLQNHMILYAVNGTFDANDFGTLCSSVKSNPISKGFNYIVVFDDAANAAFPSTPFTSLYGLEEDRIKHILAVYEYNAVNGYSESRVYDPNMWIGKPTVTKP